MDNSRLYDGGLTSTHRPTPISHTHLCRLAQASPAVLYSSDVIYRGPKTQPYYFLDNSVKN